MTRIFLFLTTLMLLTGCFQSEHEKQQELHMQQYVKALSKLLSSHYKTVITAQETAKIVAQNKQTLASLKQLKVQFEQYPDEPQLADFLAINNYAFSQLLIRNLQLFEMAKPIWQANEQKFELIKQQQYFEQHQALLNELLAMINEFDDIMLQHRESVRVKLVASTLSENYRKQVWPSLSLTIESYLNHMKPSLTNLKKKVWIEMAAAKFLNENKAHYYFDPAKGVLFDNAYLLQMFQNRVKYASHGL